MKTPLSVRTAQNLRQGLALRRNVGTTERWLSLLGGGAAIVGGVRRGGALGTGLAALGGLLVFRGASGHCPGYARLHVSTARGEDGGLMGSNEVRIHTKMHIDRPREMVYRYWRDLENLPRFMTHLKEVRADGNRSHWIARSPLGLTISWDAQVTQDTPNERLAWRSLPASRVDTRGEVRFRPAAVGDGTELEIELYYRPPGGGLSRGLASMLGGISERGIARDLERFKQMIESQATGISDQGLGREPHVAIHG